MLAWIADWVARNELADLREKLRVAEYERDSFGARLAVKEDELEALGHSFAALRQQVLNLHAALVQQGRVLGVPDDNAGS